VDQGALGEDLDGIHAACQSCNVDGKIVWESDADEDGTFTTIRFRKLTETEESELAALACDDRDEVELEVDRMFQAKDLEELANALIRDGWFERPGLAKCGPKKSDLPN
jgi:hypothetical protein